MSTPKSTATHPERVPALLRVSGAVLICFLLGVPVLRGGVTGTISGVVRDTSGATIPGVQVVATNVDTGVKSTTLNDNQGFYSFQALPVGNYEIAMSKTGFKEFREVNLVLTVNASVTVDATLQVGAVSQQVEVSSSSVQVDTASTQMGQVIESKQITSVPLNGRSYTDLLALQPGVVPLNSGINPTGETSSPAQTLNPGNLSISGQRETANAFLVNGALVEDLVQQGAAIVPNLDSIAEFRILTNNFDAEYGDYSGGQINVITKCGANSFHGDVFEFLRNTDLDARNFFSQTRGDFRQNQFGGTIGGPVRRNKVFFFGDYQGTRQEIGVDTGQVAVPSPQDRTGNLSDVANSLTGTVNGAGWAGVLTQQLGYPVSDGEAYYTSGCSSTAQCVFPGAIIPQAGWAAPASKLLSYIPAPNNANGTFSTSRIGQPLVDNEWSSRVDANTRGGLLSGYYFFDTNNLNNPYPQGSIPGFNGLAAQRSQLAQISDTKSFGASTVNQFRVNYVRNKNASYQPVGGVGPKISSFGIDEGCSTLGVCVLAPTTEGVPRIDFNTFTIGVASHTGVFVQNSYQAADSFSKVAGAHTFGIGGEYHLDQVDEFLHSRNNGDFQFRGTETGSGWADFLIGAPTTYEQGFSEPMYNRTQYFGLYAQDSWRVRSNLTLNYGLRWDVSYPWWEKDNEMETVVPGKQSATFPGAPLGWVFPGDPGIPKTVSPVGWHNFAPRIGVAYSPKADSGLLKSILGGPGESSIRAAFGLFYTQMGEYGSTQVIGDAPFGYFWASSSPPMFTEPFVARNTQQSETQRFPVPFAPLNVSPSNPDNSLDWAQFEPISSSPGWNIHNRLPYGENYMLSFERQFGPKTVMTLSYVGSEGRRLLVNLESNPSDPALCLSVSQPSQVAPGSQTCGPFNENNVFVTAAGNNVVVRPLGPGLGSDGLYTSIGNSNYNALEASLHHRSGRMEFLASYTYSKAMDNASEITEQVNPFNPSLSRGLSAFDLTHNFVASYSYELPFDKFLPANRATRGWIVSGITRFSTGLPVSITETDDQALIGNWATGIDGLTTDEPILAPGNVLNHTNPRSGQTYVNTSLFSQEILGQVGNSPRRFFHGPGINNWDMALRKQLALTESKALEFRFEFFNVFNHAQFNNPDGEFTDSTFGEVTSAKAARIGQVALKFLF
jgi:hypothetical protein